jgi:hypothetical protein
VVAEVFSIQRVLGPEVPAATVVWALSGTRRTVAAEAAVVEAAVPTVQWPAATAATVASMAVQVGVVAAPVAVLRPVPAALARRASSS